MCLAVDLNENVIIYNSVTRKSEAKWDQKRQKKQPTSPQKNWNCLWKKLYQSLQLKYETSPPPPPTYNI